ncbi:CBS domain-containing protein [Trichloromonas sp.]|uniref:CBS domain-containing protein n=1 Tax=Trichloromonas sp. TaxID=3069249 RepID=UPI003D814D80
MSVGEVCIREVIITGRETPVAELAELMRRHHVGDILVTEDRDDKAMPVGIVTDRDLVIKLLAAGVDPQTVTAEDVMSGDLQVVEEGADLLDTIKRMRAQGVPRIPVVKRNGELVGLLAFDELLELLAEQLDDLVQLIRSGRKHEEDRRI